MPIRYRCFNCSQLISISTRMAGRSVNCPKCKTKTNVPEEDQVQPTQTAATRTAPDRQAAQSETSRPEKSQTGRAKSAVSTSYAKTSTDWNEEEEEEDEGFRLGRQKPEMEEMDLTPMVDVTFLLLIFFMITASFSLQKTIQVPPPELEQEGQSAKPKIEDFEQESIIVNIDADNNIYLDDELLTDNTALVDAFRANVKSELLITAHNDAFHETVVLVVDSANEAGMQKIRLASRAGGF